MSPVLLLFLLMMSGGNPLHTSEGGIGIVLAHDRERETKASGDVGREACSNLQVTP